MADAPQEPAAAPLTLRLSIPTAPAFRGIGTSLAAKFARTAGCSDDEATRLEADVARAADQVAGAAGDGANLDFELEHGPVGGVEIRIRQTGGAPEIVRLPPHP